MSLASRSASPALAGSISRVAAARSLSGVAAAPARSAWAAPMPCAARHGPGCRYRRPGALRAATAKAAAG
jgi:hypothetical protein